MKISPLVHSIWKIPLCGFTFFLGFIPGQFLATWIGLPAPEMPAGASQTTVFQLTMLGSLLLAGGLAVVARGLSSGFISRWLQLFFLAWIAYGVNNYFEASIFTNMAAGALYSVVLYLPALLLSSLAVAWLFPPVKQGEGFFSQARAFFATRAAGSWLWRTLAAFLAFPLGYYIFGSLIAPIVIPYYQQSADQLRLPGWDQILPVLAIRSLLFLLCSLPILITWKLSNLRLFLSLGLTLFLLVGGISMLVAYWLDPLLRVVHSLEMFSDEILYAGALVLLLSAPKVNQGSAAIPAISGRKGSSTIRSM